MILFYIYLNTSILTFILGVIFYNSKLFTNTLNDYVKTYKANEKLVSYIPKIFNVVAFIPIVNILYIFCYLYILIFRLDSIIYLIIGKIDDLLNKKET